MRVSTTLVSEFRSDVKLLDYSFQWKNDSECDWMYWHETFKHDEMTRVIRGPQLLEVQCNVLARFSLMRDVTNIIYPSPWFGQVTRTNQPWLVLGVNLGISWFCRHSANLDIVIVRVIEGPTQMFWGRMETETGDGDGLQKEQVALAMSHMWHSLTPRDLCLCCSI